VAPSTPPPPTTLCGILIPIQWDAAGLPKAIALAADNEGMYRIDLRGTVSRGLMQLLRRRVELTGRIRPGTGRHSWIHITDYRVLPHSKARTALDPETA